MICLSYPCYSQTPLIPLWSLFDVVISRISNRVGWRVGPIWRSCMNLLAMADTKLMIISIVAKLYRSLTVT